MTTYFERLHCRIPIELADLLSSGLNFAAVSNIDELIRLAVGGKDRGWHEVAYELPGGDRALEATVCRVKNGVAANYPEPYMRRRDPDCLFIADPAPTDKPRFVDRFGEDFGPVRSATLEWLRTQDLTLLFFVAGAPGKGGDAVAVVPSNAAFFALALAQLQGFLPPDELPPDFAPEAVVYVAPPFRHTHFGGKQVVVHNRTRDVHELFSYNLYPGPSAKKGIYGVLLNIGEREEWLTAHCSTVRVVTPYDNHVTIMHEGASGGGKSEMLEQIHRERDGRLLLGENLVTREREYLTLARSCTLRPITDDMALCHPSLDMGSGRLSLMDAEDGWFVRVNHIAHYGVDPHLEEVTIHPSEPLLFLNIDAAPGGTALIWEHIEDAPGEPCPNPRVVLPRRVVPDVIDGAVQVEIRSFGVRTPPCTREAPSYGIFGLFHILPPALAWLWRLVAPRGYANPSIVGSDELASEGVGSYWPFATGRRVDQANLLLRQILKTSGVRYILCPNQHVGAWRTGFMPQWIARDYLARRGGAWFTRDQVAQARCPLLGYTPKSLMFEGQTIPSWFLNVETQPEIGQEGYDRGAEMLTNFFHATLRQFLDEDLLPIGKQVIETCLAYGTLGDYEALMDISPLVPEN